MGFIFFLRCTLLFFFFNKIERIEIESWPFILKDCCFLRLVSFSEFRGIVSSSFQGLVGQSQPGLADCISQWSVAPPRGSWTH